MQCQLQVSPDVLLMGGHQEKIIEFNLLRRQETKLVCTNLPSLYNNFLILFIQYL